jgi:hypothetical protein
VPHRGALDELAFLAMECERLGAGRSIGGRYSITIAGALAIAPAATDRLSKAIGALIRARIAILHLQEAPVRDPAKWPKRAVEHLEIARRECRHFKPVAAPCGT